MKKLNYPIRKEILLDEKREAKLQKAANQRTNGNVSELIRKMIDELK